MGDLGPILDYEPVPKRRRRKPMTPVRRISRVLAAPTTFFAAVLLIGGYHEGTGGHGWFYFACGLLVAAIGSVLWMLMRR